MLGLLLKDLYNLRKQAIWYLSMIVVFFGLSIILNNVAFASTIGILVTISMPLTAIAYEEKDGWQKFVVASGTKISTIVGEKYLLGIVFAAIGLIAYSLTFMLVVQTEQSAVEYTLPACMQFFTLAVILPVIFRFGVEKGRAYMIVVIVIIMLMLIGVLTFLKDVDKGETLLIICAWVVAAVVTVVSYFISVRIYKKKEF